MAVGSRAFVTEAKERHGIRAKGRKMVETDDFFELVLSTVLLRALVSFRSRNVQFMGGNELREPPPSYEGISGHEKAAIRFQNEYYWENFVWFCSELVGLDGHNLSTVDHHF